MLNDRQRAAYVHKCNLWSVTRTVNATTGVAGAETYTLAYSGVLCRYEYTDNLSDPIEGAGRIKRPTVFTTDAIHMDAAQPCGEGWIAKNVSLLPNGTQSPLYGEFHRILGAARISPSAGNRRANKRKMLAQSMEKPPAGVT